VIREAKFTMFTMFTPKSFATVETGNGVLLILYDEQFLQFSGLGFVT